MNSERAFELTISGRIKALECFELGNALSPALRIECRVWRMQELGSGGCSFQAVQNSSRSCTGPK